MARSPGAHSGLVRSYVFMIMAVVFLGLLIFGAILLFAAKEYFEGQTIEALRTRAQEASRQTTQNLAPTANAGEYMTNNDALYLSYALLSVPEKGTAKYTIILADTSGKIIRSYGTDATSLPGYINMEFCRDALEASYSGYTKLGGVFSENHGTAGVSVYSPADDDNALGVIFVSCPASESGALLNYLIMVFLIGGVAVLAFTFASLSVATDRLLSPLGEM
jgi:hypothetical protein